MRQSIAFFLISSVLATGLVAQTETGLPISKERLIQALQYRAFTPDQILARVQARGVDFEATDEDAKDIRASGASARLISAIKSKYRPLSEVKQRASEGPDDILVGPPLMEREIVLLLKAHIPADKVAAAAAARGVDFALNRSYNKDIWGAGGNLALMGEILLCSRAKDAPAPVDQLFPVPEGPANMEAPAKIVEAAAVKIRPAEPPVEPAPAPVRKQPVVAAAPVKPPSQAKSLLPPFASGPPIQEVPAPSMSQVDEGRPRRIEVDAALQATKVTFRATPVYPSSADRHLAGLVRLEVVIGADGRVIATKGIKGDPRLVSSAEAAVRRWTYRPTVIDGQQVEIVTTVEIMFSPKN